MEAQIGVFAIRVERHTQWGVLHCLKDLHLWRRIGAPPGKTDHAGYLFTQHGTDAPMLLAGAHSFL